ETATRLVLALEAQFPGQAFEMVRHPRCETVEDLQLACAAARGRPAVMVYTLVEPGLRETMRQLCRRSRLHYCDLLGHPIDWISSGSTRSSSKPPRSTVGSVVRCSTSRSCRWRRPPCGSSGSSRSAAEVWQQHES